MLFNSVEFAIFIIIVFALCWIVPPKYRWIVLIAASLVFYASYSLKTMPVLLIVIVTTYICALKIDSGGGKKRKCWLILAIVIPIVFLIYYKYFGFLVSSVYTLLRAEKPTETMWMNVILPVGISFYTFQAIGYVIDIYRGKYKAEKHFGYYALHIIFFPHILSGPIAKGNDLLPQIRQPREFDYSFARDGLRLIAWGFMKKYALADTLAIYSSKVFSDVNNYTGGALLAASVFFFFQIYCDFSGYSDFVTGIARLLGIELKRNFNSPYFSNSVKDFWGRWHISLSAWLKDYIYIPLGGSRCTKSRHVVNILITFLVSGIWHGADYTFIVWGLLHGIARAIENLTGLDKTNKRNIFSVLLTCLFVWAAWIFFKANSIQDALYVFSNMFRGISKPVDYLYKGYKALNIKIDILIRCGIMLSLVGIYDYIELKRDVNSIINSVPLVLRWSAYLLFIWMLVAFMPFGVEQEFIYFQF